MGKKFRIHGRAIKTDVTWVGKGVFTEQEVRSAVDAMNRDNDGFSFHWIEEAEEVEEEEHD